MPDSRDTTSPAVRAIIERLSLQPHPEGGYFRETYRATTQVDTPRGPRAASTSIFYLLATGDRSRLHRIQSDEVWHFYAGDPLQVVVLDENESSGDGGFTLSGDHPQDVVLAGKWFGAHVVPGAHGYALVGCTVAPGFDFADFEIADGALLLKQFPDECEWIEALS